MRVNDAVSVEPLDDALDLRLLQEFSDRRVGRVAGRSFPVEVRATVYEISIPQDTHVLRETVARTEPGREDPTPLAEMRPPVAQEPRLEREPRGHGDPVVASDPSPCDRLPRARTDSFRKDLRDPVEQPLPQRPIAVGDPDRRGTGREPPGQGRRQERENDRRPRGRRAKPADGPADAVRELLERQPVRGAAQIERLRVRRLDGNDQPLEPRPRQVLRLLGREEGAVRHEAESKTARGPLRDRLLDPGMERRLPHHVESDPLGQVLARDLVEEPKQEPEVHEPPPARHQVVRTKLTGKVAVARELQVDARDREREPADCSEFRVRRSGLHNTTSGLA